MKRVLPTADFLHVISDGGRHDGLRHPNDARSVYLPEKPNPPAGKG